jgi:hypothetical protein
MDESKLQLAISDRDSIYISLLEQRNAETEGEGSRSPRRRISRERTTRIHFPIHHDKHWAAVQLSISPFELRQIPNQKFFRCRFRYTWCCETVPTADISREVQQIYDCYFQPTQWDFSSIYWYVLGKLSLWRCAHTFSRDIDLPNPASFPNEIPCLKKVESNLIYYIQRGTVSDDKECPRSDCDGSDGFAHGIKRRRIDTSDDVNCGRDRDATYDRDNHHHGTDDEIVEGDNNGRGIDDEEHGDDATTDVDLVTEEDKFAQSVVKKINKGLREMLCVKKSKQLQVGASTNVAINKDLVIAPDFIHFAEGESFEERCLYLEHFFEYQSANAFRSAREIAWKCCFIVACLRQIREPTLRTRASKSAIRWILAMRMINAIVNGLWEFWGPKAGLVYEALASRSDAPSFDAAIDLFPGTNYHLTFLVECDESTREKVVKSVINILRVSIPDVPSNTPLFHPAGYISYTLKHK